MRFFDSIQVPLFELKGFNDDVLKHSIKFGAFNDPNKLNFTWNIISLGVNEITIQLDF